MINIDANHRIQDCSFKIYTKIPLNYKDKFKLQGINLKDSRTSGGFSIFETFYHVESEEDIDKAKYIVGLALKMHNN